MEPLFLSFTLSSKGYCNLPPTLFLERYYPTTLLILLQYVRSSTMEPLFLSFTLSSKGYCNLPPMLFLVLSHYSSNPATIYPFVYHGTSLPFFHPFFKGILYSAPYAVPMLFLAQYYPSYEWDH